MADGGFQTFGSLVDVCLQICKFVAGYKDAGRAAKQLKKTAEGLTFALEEARNVIRERTQLTANRTSDIRENRRIEQVEGTVKRVERALRALVKQVYGIEDITELRRPGKNRMQKAANAFFPQRVAGLQAQLQLDLTILHTSLLLLQISDTSILRLLRRDEPDADTVQTSSRTLDLARALSLQQSKAREIFQASHQTPLDSSTSTSPSEVADAAAVSKESGGRVDDLEKSISEAAKLWQYLLSGSENDAEEPEAIQDPSELQIPNHPRQTTIAQAHQSRMGQQHDGDVVISTYPLPLIKRHIVSYREDADSLIRDEKWKQSKRSLKKLIYWSQQRAKILGESLDSEIEIGMEEELGMVLMRLGQQDEGLQRTETLESAPMSAVPSREDDQYSISLRSARLYQLKALLYFDKYLKSVEYSSGRRTDDLSCASELARSAFSAHYAFFQLSSDDLDKSRVRASAQLFIDTLDCMEDATEAHDVKDEITDLCGWEYGFDGNGEARDLGETHENVLSPQHQEIKTTNGSGSVRSARAAPPNVQEQDWATSSSSDDTRRHPAAHEDGRPLTLPDAARMNDDGEVMKLLRGDSSCDINLADSEGFAALHYASSSGNIDIVTALLENDANVNSKTAKGDTALLLAVKNMHVTTIRALLKEGDIDLQAKFRNGWTVLHYAVEEDEVKTTVTLLDHSASKDLIDAQDKDGKTALHYCAQNGRLAQANVLLDRSPAANVNLQTFHDKLTPLHLALDLNRTSKARELIDLILNAGPNLDAAIWTKDQKNELKRHRERRDSAVNIQAATNGSGQGSSDDRRTTTTKRRRNTLSWDSILGRHSTNGNESRRRGTVS